MKKYNFLNNVQKHIDKTNEETKKIEIGRVINSLQRPFTEVLQAVALKQQKDVDKLYKSLGWEKKY